MMESILFFSVTGLAMVGIIQGRSPWRLLMVACAHVEAALLWARIAAQAVIGVRHRYRECLEEVWNSR